MKELDSFGSLKEGNVVSEVSECPARRRAGEADRSCTWGALQSVLRILYRSLSEMGATEGHLKQE